MLFPKYFNPVNLMYNEYFILQNEYCFQRMFQLVKNCILNILPYNDLKWMLIPKVCFTFNKCCSRLFSAYECSLGSVFTNHSQEHSLCFSPRICKFECNATSDWLHHTV